MLFNSYEFILFFLPAAFIGFFCIARVSRLLAASWLAAASLFFYGWWNPRFVLLLASSITFNYAMGYALARAGNATRARMLLVIALVTNLACLGYFKYTNFFIATVNATAGTTWNLADIVLPLGISFFTFTQITFLVDVYRGIAREYNFIHYVLFVTYFPHLIAGPILHHKQMMPQFAQAGTYRINADYVAAGLTVFTIGLVKKVFLADSFADYANPIFNASKDGIQPEFTAAWIGAIGYALQLYFDFSGYSDMAIGLSLLFGITLPLNFNSPYKAYNIIEFWRRWHMSLSRFLRDYLYIPLGGGRKGRLRRYLNLLITMLLGGMWHGANWTFIAWGGLHGLFLTVNHAWLALKSRLGWTRESGTVGRIAGTMLTFLAVVVGWVFFRADSFDSAMRMLAGMAQVGDFGHGVSSAALDAVLTRYRISPASATYLAGLFGIGCTIVFLAPNTQNLVSRIRLDTDVRRFGMIGVLLFVILVTAIVNASRGASEFIYFNF